jgi:hypothetical protein
MASTSTAVIAKAEQDMSLGDAKSLSKRLTQNFWDDIDRHPLSEFDKKITKLIVEYANSKFGINTTGVQADLMKVLGDSFFDTHSKTLVEKHLISKESLSTVQSTQSDQPDEKKKKAKKGSNADKAKIKTADKIREENTKAVIEKALTDALDNFSLQQFRIPSAFSSKFLEIRAVGILQYLHYLKENFSDLFGKDSKISFVYNIIVMTEKFIKICSTYVGESFIDASIRIPFSAKLVTAIQQKLSIVKRKYQYFGLDVCNRAPHLLISTDYDYIMPEKQLDLRAFQKELVDTVHSSIIADKPKIIKLDPMTGTGKTTIALGIVQLIKQLRSRNSHDSRVVVFCCTVHQVLIQIGNISYFNGVKLCYASIDKFRGFEITNQYDCKNDSDRELILCGPEACIEVMKQYPNAVLFDDEWSIGLDAKENVDKNQVVTDNITILAHCLPKIAILSTATPSFPQWIIEKHTEKYGDTDFHQISSNTVHIPCEILTHDGIVFTPHSWCKTSDDIHHAIKKINANPFLGRAYTANIVYNMFQIMKKNRVANMESYENIFMDAINLTADKMRLVAIDLLTELANYTSDIITAVCSAKITPRVLSRAQPVTKKESSDGIVWEEDTPAGDITYNIVYEKLFTTHAHLCIQPTLIADLEPMTFALTYGTELVEMFTQKYGTLKKVQRDHENAVSLWEKEKARFEADGKKKTKFDSELDRLQKEAEVLQSKPTIKNSFQINTVSHLNKFAKGSPFLNRNMEVRSEIDVTDIITTDMNVPDELVILLACGVGVYGVDCPFYKKIVASLMNQGKLAFVISDASIAYGINVKLNRVIATSAFCNAYAEKTIFQLISRAGRVGRSDTAEAFLPESCINEIISSIKSTIPDDDVQGRNMEMIYQKISDITASADDELIERILREHAEKEETERKQREEEQARIAEQKRIAEEQALIAEQKRRAEEEELLRLQELKMRRQNTQRSVPLSSVMSNPPTNTFTSTASNGFERRSTGRVDRRTPQNSQPQKKKSMLDKLNDIN